MRRLLALATGAIVGTLAAGGFAMAADTKHKIEDLSWLAGSWETANAAERWTDEHWTTPAGGAMLGMSRTLKAGVLAEFEYLRIVQKGDDLVYIAHPGGRAPGTELQMTSLTEGAAGHRRGAFGDRGDGSRQARVDWRRAARSRPAAAPSPAADAA